jgi:NitT/TauT family transport system substrate-binding protein
MQVQKFLMPPFAVSAIAAATTIMILVAGCSSGPGSGAPSRAGSTGETNISVAALPAADLAGLYIAQDDGLFARQGLRVSIEKIASSQAVVAGQLAGRFDISAGSYIPYIAAEAQGARFRILAEASSLGTDSRVLAVPARSSVTTIGKLVGGKIGVNGTNSIGTLLISALLAENGYSPKKVHFVTDPSGFPAMPHALNNGVWEAAFLAEPYVTLAEEQYGERILADLDQGATLNFPIDGYVATSSWAKAHPSTVAAFVRAIEAGQVLAASSHGLVEQALAKSDNLSPEVTSLISLPVFPVGPVNETRIEREATDMLQFGMLSSRYATEVSQGTLVRSMI